jgi:hypothetical protein
MISQTASQLIAVGAGALVVPITSLFKSKGWDVKVKFLLSAVLSVLASLGISIPADATNDAVVNYGGTAAIVFATAQVLYKLVFEGTKAEDKLANVGSGTKVDTDLPEDDRGTYAS